MQSLLSALLILLCSIHPLGAGSKERTTKPEVTRVFIFAGQSNMVGSDSKAKDIDRYPPFTGLGEPQKKVLFSYNIGREDKLESDGWSALQPVRDVVGPELSFARKVAGRVDAPIAIIKCAAGGTHLGGDWNPDQPAGYKMYPLLLDVVRGALAELEAKGIRYQLEGFFWHQGENDMFEDSFRENYGVNLANFVGKVRKDLDVPNLSFYLGELCTKTVWGMDLRSSMYAISLGQKEVAEADPLVTYVPTSNIATEIGGGTGLHYHYGTLGQLEHGVNYADAYLTTLGLQDETSQPLAKWPYKKGATIQLFVMAGHRNMEGERAFVQELRELRKGKALAKDNLKVAYSYSLGGGYLKSTDWEALGPRGYYDTFGPELSFGQHLNKKLKQPIAIAKFTHSGSQMVDWTPAGSDAKSRNLYPGWIAFVKQSIESLQKKGHEVELAGIFYHMGENDMSYFPFREQAAGHLKALVNATREDLSLADLPWFVSQQPPTDDEQLNRCDVTAMITALAASDKNLDHIKVFDLPAQEKQLVLDTVAIVELGRRLAKAFLARR